MRRNKSAVLSASESLLSKLTAPKGILKKLIGLEVYVLLDRDDEDSMPIIVRGRIESVDRDSSTCCIHVLVVTEHGSRINTSLDQVFEEESSMRGHIAQVKMSHEVTKFKSSFEGHYVTQTQRIARVKAEKGYWPIVWNQLLVDGIVETLPENLVGEFPSRAAMRELTSSGWTSIIENLVKQEFPDFRPTLVEED